MNAEFYDWVAESIAYGLSRLFSLIDSGVKVDFDFYTDEEKAADPEKAGTKLFYIPGRIGAPFVVVCPGGGYGAVCSLKEGFTTAARLNELGYDAFVLSYRVRAMGTGDGSGIMPKPLDDMAAAMRFINKNADKFGVSLDKYAVAGFSSGGHLAGEWGTKNVGAVSYGITPPKAIFLGYPASDTTEYRSLNGQNFLLANMLGKDYSKDDVAKYNVNAQIDAITPPLICGIARMIILSRLRPRIKWSRNSKGTISPTDSGKCSTAAMVSVSGNILRPRAGWRKLSPSGNPYNSVIR